MKVGIIFDDTLDSNDGVQQYIKTLARWLIGKGHDVRFLVGESYDDSEFKDKLISLSVKNIKVRGNGNSTSLPVLPNIPKIIETIKKEKFDILHVQMPYSPTMAQIVMALSDLPTVGTFHSLSGTQLVTLGYNLLSVIQQGSLDSIIHKITVSSAAQEFAREHFGIEDSVIIPNMLNLKEITKGKPLKKYQDGKFNIFFLGRLVERKGTKYLLKAYKKLIADTNNKNLRLIIAGKGHLESELKEFVRKNKLTNVDFAGFIPEAQKADYYASADLCVFPAWTGESFGIVLIEAMAAGKTIIAGLNDGYKSVLTGAGSLLLVDVHDTNLFAEKLNAMITYPELRKFYSEWAKQEVLKYDVEVVGKQILQLYQDALQKHVKIVRKKSLLRPAFKVISFVFNLLVGLVRMVNRFFKRFFRNSD